MSANSVSARTGGTTRADSIEYGRAVDERCIGVPQPVGPPKRRACGCSVPDLAVTVERWRRRQRLVADRLFGDGEEDVRACSVPSKRWAKSSYSWFGEF